MNLSMESFKDGGAFWFQDLTMADPTYILPLISTSLILLNMEISSRTQVKTQIPPKFATIFKWGLRGVMVISFPFISQFETSFMMYWIAANSFTCIQTFLLSRSSIKKRLGIPVPVGHQEKDLFSKVFKKKPEKIKLYSQQEIHKKIKK
jgi:YidC/Oxa1 family membrane protein insertase